MKQTVNIEETYNHIIMHYNSDYNDNRIYNDPSIKKYFDTWPY